MHKKIHFFFLMLFGVLILTACKPKTASLDVDAILARAQAEIDLAGPFSSDLSLPSSVEIDEYNVSITWESLNPIYLSNSGVMTRPRAAVGNQEIELRATFSLLSKTRFHTFRFTILALDPETFTIYFDEGAGIDPVPFSIWEGETVFAYEPDPRLGYEIAGWSTTSETVTLWDFSKPATDNMTLYAVWQPIEYTITYHLDDATHTGIYNNTYTILDYITTFGSATKAGYTFIGWFNAASGGDAVTEVEVGSYGHIELFAQFASGIQWSVTLDKDIFGRETILVPNQTLFDEPILEPVTGYAFDGWYKDSDYKETFDFTTEEIISDITLYLEVTELIGLNLYGYQSINIAQIQNPAFTDLVFILSKEHRLYAKGANTHGLLGNGTTDPVLEFIDTTPFYALEADEIIVDFYVNYYYYVVVITSNNRIFFTGTYRSFSFDDYQYLTPQDLTESIDLGEITYVHMDLDYVIFVDEEDQIVKYEQGIFNRITPVYLENESISSFIKGDDGKLADPFAFYTNQNRIFKHDDNQIIELANGSISYTVSILYVQNEGAHLRIWTQTQYMEVPHDEPENLVIYPLILDLLEGETIFLAHDGIIITSHQRFLVQVEQKNLSLEIISVYYADISSQIDLQSGESVVTLINGYQFYTNQNRLISMTSFAQVSYELDFIPEVASEYYDLSPYLYENEHLIYSYWTINGTHYLTSERGIQLVPDFSTGLSVILMVYFTGQVYQETRWLRPTETAVLAPINDIEGYAFMGWYHDMDLTIPYNHAILSGLSNLYGSREKTHYLITFAGSINDPILTNYDAIPATPKIPSLTHYTFTHWYYYDADLGVEITYLFDVPLNKDVMLYPAWTHSHYIVTAKFDLTETTSSLTVESLISIWDIIISLPQGYYVSGIYYNALHSEPVLPDDLLLSNVTLYYALEVETMKIHYFLDIEDVEFIEIFSTDYFAYGLNAQGEIYGWGVNHLGGLFGDFESIFTFEHPFNFTHYFNLNSGEIIVDVYVFYYMASKVVITSENRVFVWNHSSEELESLVEIEDVTAKLALASGEVVMDVYLSYQYTWFITNLGRVLVYNYQANQVHQYQTSIESISHVVATTFMPTILAEEFLIITTDSIVKIAYTGHLISELSYTSHLSGDVVVAAKRDQQYQIGIHIITDSGRQLYLDYNDLMMQIGTLILENDEAIIGFHLEAEGQVVQTNQRWLYRHGTDDYIEIDLTVIHPMDAILAGYHASYYSRLGHVYTFDADAIAFISYHVFSLDVGEEIVEIRQVLDHTYAYTNQARYLNVSGNVVPLKAGRYDTQVITISPSDEPYTLLVPLPRHGYVFVGWYTDLELTDLLTIAPTQSMILYGKWDPE